MINGQLYRQPGDKYALPRIVVLNHEVFDIITRMHLTHNHAGKNNDRRCAVSTAPNVPLARAKLSFLWDFVITVICGAGTICL
jgi:hypothetical protein